MVKRRKQKHPKGPESFLERVRRSLGGEGEGDAAAEDHGSTAHAPSPDPQLIVADDGLEAVVPTVYPGTTEAQIVGLLSREGVSCGVDRKAIRRAVTAAAARGRPLDHVVVARGCPPRPPSDPRLQYQLPNGLESLPDLEPVRQSLGAAVREHLEEALPAAPVWAVGPGDLMATAVWEPGASGSTVRGQDIPVSQRQPEDLSHLALQAGPGIDVSGDTVEFSASRWGYACLIRGQLSVLKPLWIRADDAEASLVVLPWVAGSRAPTVDDLRSLVGSSGLVEGIDEEALARACGDLTQAALERALVPVARWRAPVYPRDAEASFSFRYESGAGAVRADGSIDFKERNAFPPVDEGDLLAECRLAVAGQEGVTVRGEAIPVREPKRSGLAPGANVRLAESEGLQQLYAEIDGGAIVQVDEIASEAGLTTCYTVAVQPVTQISGDVDYRSGNVDVPGNVIVSGSVTAGFRVKAGGDVAISGSVEAGAVVSAGGSITVQQGIVGETTHLDAGGSVTAKFVQEATVEAGSDIVLGSYAHGARLSTFGHLHVEGAGGVGGIAGGRTWALQGISTRSLGAVGGTATEVLVGLQRDGMARLEKLRKAVDRVEEALARLLQSLAMESFAAEAVRELIASTADEATRRCAHQAQQLAAARERYAQTVERLTALVGQGGAGATVEVPEMAYTGTTVRVGDQHTVLSADVKAVRFGLDPEGHQRGVVERELGAARKR